jgi:2-polyprenyl-3-methyl-5-hydroxy-6-metoxy-1,4-benzoquinol methylase
MGDDGRDPTLRRALVEHAMGRASGRGEIELPALPSLAGEYAAACAHALAPFGTVDADALRDALKDALERARSESVHARVAVKYEHYGSPHVRYEVETRIKSLEELYGEWNNAAGASSFGKHPDAKVMELSATLAPGRRCLDIGAGDGRNAIPLARAGMDVLAVEPAPALADAIERAARDTGIALRVLRANALDPAFQPEPGAYALVVVSEVTSHLRDAAELSRLVDAIAPALASDGAILMNAFMCEEGFEPDALTRELSALVWSTVFTHDDLRRAVAVHRLVLASDEGFADYERHRQPSWPPTRWYERWAYGYDLFPQHVGSHAEMRWLVLRRA